MIGRGEVGKMKTAYLTHVLVLLLLLLFFFFVLFFIFFIYGSLLGDFCTENAIKKREKNGQVLNNPQMRLLLKKSYRDLLQIQKTFIN